MHKLNTISFSITIPKTYKFLVIRLCDFADTDETNCNKYIVMYCPANGCVQRFVNEHGILGDKFAAAQFASEDEAIEFMKTKFQGEPGYM